MLSLHLILGLPLVWVLVTSIFTLFPSSWACVHACQRKLACLTLNPLDPIEISENPSEILGRSPFLTKYGSIWFFHNDLFNIEYLLLQVTFILINIVLPTKWYRTRPCILHNYITDMSFHYLLYKDRSYSMGSAGINSELEIKLDKCPISTVAVKFPIFARIFHTIYKHINVWYRFI